MLTTSQKPPLNERLREALVSSPWLVVGLALGLGAIIGGITALGPIYIIAGIAALAVALAVLVSTNLGMVAIFSIITLIPFGTLPFRAVITPSFLELALGGLLVVWFLRMLADSERFDLRLSALGLPLLGFLGLTFFSLILGAQGLPDNATLRSYLKFVLAVLLFFTIVNCVRSPDHARFTLRAMIGAGTAGALLGFILWALPDAFALSLLVSLGRIGYPTDGRVLRYVEDDVNGLERAIATSVDPNSYGGMLALVGVLAATQLVSNRPVWPRWWLALCTGLIGLVLILTFSRAALLGLVIAAVYLATVRYRRLWFAMIGMAILGGGLLFGLGFADEFTERFVEGVRFEDQAQQMRLAEFENAFAIIERYPFFGIGFGQAPDLDLVAGVSSIYLAIGQRIGLVGLTAFLAIVGYWFWLTWQTGRTSDPEREGWLLCAQGAIVAALSVGLADHYFFNIEFSHMVALFWATIGFGMAVVGIEPHTPEEPEN